MIFAPACTHACASVCATAGSGGAQEMTASWPCTADATDDASAAEPTCTACSRATSSGPSTSRSLSGERTSTETDTLARDSASRTTALPSPPAAATTSSLCMAARAGTPHVSKAWDGAEM